MLVLVQFIPDFFRSFFSRICMVLLIFIVEDELSSGLPTGETGLSSIECGNSPFCLTTHIEKVTSSWLEAELLDLSLLAEANISKIIIFGEVQEYLLERSHRLHDQELIERLKRKGMTVKRLNNKQRREQERITVKQSDLSTSTNDDDQTEEITGTVQIEHGQCEI